MRQENFLVTLVCTADLHEGQTAKVPCRELIGTSPNIWIGAVWFETKPIWTGATKGWGCMPTVTGVAKGWGGKIGVGSW